MSDTSSARLKRPGKSSWRRSRSWSDERLQAGPVELTGCDVQAVNEALKNLDAISDFHEQIGQLDQRQARVDSPARYAHINPYGKYRFNVEGEFHRKGLRPLRRPDSVMA